MIFLHFEYWLHELLAENALLLNSIHCGSAMHFIHHYFIICQFSRNYFIACIMSHLWRNLADFQVSFIYMFVSQNMNNSVHIFFRLKWCEGVNSIPSSDFYNYFSIITCMHAFTWDNAIPNFFTVDPSKQARIIEAMMSKHWMLYLPILLQTIMVKYICYSSICLLFIISSLLPLLLFIIENMC